MQIKKILYFVQLPPPVHGVCTMNKMVLDDNRLSSAAKTIIQEIRFSGDISQINSISIRKLLILVKLFFRLIFKIVKERPDYVYFTPVPTGIGFLRDLLFISVFKYFKLKIIYHIHGKGISEKHSNKIWVLLYRYAFNNTYIISISSLMKTKDFNNLGLMGAKHFMLPNAVKIIKNRRSIDLRNDGVCNILFLSGTFPSKGVMQLLEVAKLLKNKSIKFKLTLVGRSTKENDDNIQKFVQENNLSKYVTCPGALYDEEKYKAFSLADVFVHPTLNDYFPLVLLEAMQFGLPIVSTLVGGIPEIVEHNVNGLLCEPGDVSSLEKNLLSIINDVQLRNRLGKKSRELYLTNYTPEIFSKKLFNIFSEIKAVH